jgi:hypothetical protein
VPWLEGLKLLERKGVTHKDVDVAWRCGMLTFHDPTGLQLMNMAQAEEVWPQMCSEEQQSSPALDPPDPMAGLQPEKRDGTPKDIRLSDEERAETYTKNYIEAEKKAGRAPTLTGIRRAAVNDGFSGAREALRAAFDKQYGVKRGRRKKSAE